MSTFKWFPMMTGRRPTGSWLPGKAVSGCNRIRKSNLTRTPHESSARELAQVVRWAAAGLPCRQAQTRAVAPGRRVRPRRSRERAGRQPPRRTACRPPRRSGPVGGSRSCSRACPYSSARHRPASTGRRSSRWARLSWPCGSDGGFAGCEVRRSADFSSSGPRAHLPAAPLPPTSAGG